jgi:uracil DNA glycosylase
MSDTKRIKDTINKLIEKYDKTSWKDILSAMFHLEDFEMAIGQLISDHKAGQPFTPHIKDIFKSYDLCALADVKVVFVSSNPHPDKGIATGLSFSGYSNDFYLTLNNKADGEADRFNLDYLPQKEGVMLLTAALTCPIGKPTDHIPVWAPLTEKLIKAISYRTVKTIFVFVGEENEHLAKQVGKNHLKFFVPTVTENWDPGGTFGNINKALIKMDKTPINW